MRLYSNKTWAVYVQGPIRKLVDKFAQRTEYKLTLKTGANYLTQPGVRIFSIAILGCHLEISKRVANGRD